MTISEVDLPSIALRRSRDSACSTSRSRRMRSMSFINLRSSLVLERCRDRARSALTQLPRYRLVASSVRPMQEGARPHMGRETSMKIVEK